MGTDRHLRIKEGQSKRQTGRQKAKGKERYSRFEIWRIYMEAVDIRAGTKGGAIRTYIPVGRSYIGQEEEKEKKAEEKDENPKESRIRRRKRRRRKKWSRGRKRKRKKEKKEKEEE